MGALEELRQKLPEVRRMFRPQHLILFGSEARGQAHEDSDIDLILVSDVFEEVPWPERGFAFFDILWGQRSVDLICLTSAEFEKLRGWAGVVATACEEGIWL